MPTFVDIHENLILPQEAIDHMAQETREGVSDDYGVRQIELYYNAEGKVICVLDGPDKDAIRKHHAALDVPCGDVNEVHSLL